MFSIDKENHSINPSLMSIKGFSQTIADSLYRLGQRHYDDFVDLLEDMRIENIAESRILDLIDMNYFSDFGSITYLNEVVKIFAIFYKNKKYIQQCLKIILILKL